MRDKDEGSPKVVFLTSSRVGMIFKRISPTVSMSALMLRMLHIKPTNDRAEHSHREPIVGQRTARENQLGGAIPKERWKQYFRSENIELPLQQSVDYTEGSRSIDPPTAEANTARGVSQVLNHFLSCQHSDNEQYIPTTNNLYK